MRCPEGIAVIAANNCSPSTVGGADADGPSSQRSLRTSGVQCGGGRAKRRARRAQRSRPSSAHLGDSHNADEAERGRLGPEDREHQ